MLQLVYGHRFEKDLMRAKERGHKIEKLTAIIIALLNDEMLPPTVSNHRLKGEFDHCWECHIEFDWLLVYNKTDTSIILMKTGSHADLF